MGSVVSTISNGVNHFLDNTVGDVFGTHQEAPAAPGIDPNLQALKNKQTAAAKDFRSNLTENKSQAAQKLQGDANRYMNKNLDDSQNSMNQRGLLYSGINAGNQGSIRADAGAKLGSAITQSNTSYDTQADQLDSDAVNTGIGIQQSQQQIQNMLYSQAQAKLAGQNAMIGAAASNGLLMAMV